MTPYHADPWLTVYAGDCREAMAAMAPESVHCVVTSPPYWGLRDYGVPGQLGLEPTPEEYVADMVAVFREVRRVLRSDGTVWLNLGDSYIAGQGGRQSAVGEMPAKTLRSDANPRQRDDVDTGSWADRDATVKTTPARGTTSLKPKDLAGVPWRVAFALQADGWYLRSDIIWAKPNPMPESVTDRPTKAHEYLFLLTKSARYYYDADAVREPSDPWAARHPDSWATGLDGGHDVVRWSRREPGAETAGTGESRSGRNLRSVWTIATEPYPGAHFATFPQKLVEPCIKAGTSERGVCPECGAPWVRETERTYRSPIITTGTEEGRYTNGRNRNVTRMGDGVDVETTGWHPTCTCVYIDGPTGISLPLTPAPAVILDPFAGSGTVGRVAQRLSRRAVLIDLNPEYLLQAMERNRDIPLGLTEAAS